MTSWNHRKPQRASRKDDIKSGDTQFLLYSNDDFNILRDIVVLAEDYERSALDELNSPGRHQTSFTHLHSAYEKILRKNGIEPAADSHFYKFLVRLASIHASTWTKKFDTLLGILDRTLDNISEVTPNQTMRASPISADDGDVDSDPYIIKPRNAIDFIKSTPINPTRDIKRPYSQASTHVSTLPPYSAYTKEEIFRAWKEYVLGKKEDKDNATAIAYYRQRLMIRAMNAWRDQLHWFYSAQNYVVDAKKKLICRRCFYIWIEKKVQRDEYRRITHLKDQEAQKRRQEEEHIRQEEQKRLREEEQRRAFERQEQMELEIYRQQQEEREREAIHLREIEKQRKMELDLHRREQEAAAVRAQQQALLEQQQRQKEIERVKLIERERQRIELERQQALNEEAERQEIRRLQLELVAQKEREEREVQQREYEMHLQAIRLERQEMDRALILEAFHVWKLRTRESLLITIRNRRIIQRVFRIWYLASWRTRAQILYETRLCKAVLSEWRTKFVIAHEHSRALNYVLFDRHRRVLKDTFKTWRAKLRASNFTSVHNLRCLDRTWERWRYTFVESRAMGQHAQKYRLHAFFTLWRQRIEQQRAYVESANIQYDRILFVRHFVSWRVKYKRDCLALKFRNRRLLENYLHWWLVNQRFRLLHRVHWKRIVRRILQTWLAHTRHVLNANIRLEEWEHEHTLTEDIKLAQVFELWRRKYQVWVNASEAADSRRIHTILGETLYAWRHRYEEQKATIEHVDDARGNFLKSKALTTWRTKARDSRRARVSRLVEGFQRAHDRGLLIIAWRMWKQKAHEIGELERIGNRFKSVLDVKWQARVFIKWKSSARKLEEMKSMAADFHNADIMKKFVQRVCRKTHRVKLLHNQVNSYMKLVTKKFFVTWQVTYRRYERLRGMESTFVKIRDLSLIGKCMVHWTIVTDKRGQDFAIASQHDRDVVLNDAFMLFRFGFQRHQKDEQQAQSYAKMITIKHVCDKVKRVAQVTVIGQKRCNAFKQRFNELVLLKCFYIWQEKKSLHLHHLGHADRARNFKMISCALETWRAIYARRMVRKRLATRSFLAAWRKISLRRHALHAALDNASKTIYAFRRVTDAPIDVIRKGMSLRALFYAWRRRASLFDALNAKAIAFREKQESSTMNYRGLVVTFTKWRMIARKHHAKTRKQRESLRIAYLVEEEKKIILRERQLFLTKFLRKWRVKTYQSTMKKQTNKHRDIILSQWKRIVNEEAALHREVLKRDTFKKWIIKTRKNEIMRMRAEEIYFGVVLREAFSLWKLQVIRKQQQKRMRKFRRTCGMRSVFKKWRGVTAASRGRRRRRHPKETVNHDALQAERDDLARRYMKYRLLRGSWSRWKGELNAKRAEKKRKSGRFAQRVTRKQAMSTPLMSDVDAVRRRQLMRLNEQTIERKRR